MSRRGPAHDELPLAPDAAALLVDLARGYRAPMNERLHHRTRRRWAIDTGERPTFLPDTRVIREDAGWRVAAAPLDLRDRRVELTGSCDRQTLIAGLNSGARVFVAETGRTAAAESTSIADEHRNLMDVVRRTIAHVDTATGRRSTLNAAIATLIVRPRCWHLSESLSRVDDVPVSAALVDTVAYVVNNAKLLLQQGSAPYFVLPRLESHLEARLWNDILIDIERACGLAAGTIRVTVPIETLSAAFEMDEILFELRERVTALQAGRWPAPAGGDEAQASVLPEWTRNIASSRMRAYTRLLVSTCHRRGAHAIGGMARHVPVQEGDVHPILLERIRQEQAGDAHAGHDGTQVAHPAFIAVAREVFDAAMPWTDQLHRVELEPPVRASDLLSGLSDLTTFAAHDGLARSRVDRRVGMFTTRYRCPSAIAQGIPSEVEG